MFERADSNAGERTDLAMMRRALLAAEEAAEKGEVPVGAVVARGGEILAVAANEREATGDPTAHAELLAIRDAQAREGSRDKDERKDDEAILKGDDEGFLAQITA